jgi:hypothetical protein
MVRLRHMRHLSLIRILYYKWLGFRTSRILFSQYAGFILELTMLTVCIAAFLPYLPHILSFKLSVAVCFTLLGMAYPLWWMIDFWFWL